MHPEIEWVEHHHERTSRCGGLRKFDILMIVIENGYQMEAYK